MNDMAPDVRKTGVANAPDPCVKAETALHLSAVIDVLRFPLISLVVLYHAFKCTVTSPEGAFDYHQPVTDFVY